MAGLARPKGHRAGRRGLLPMIISSRPQRKMQNAWCWWGGHPRPPPPDPAARDGRRAIRPAGGARKNTRPHRRAQKGCFGRKKIRASGHLPAGTRDKILHFSRIYFPSPNRPLNHRKIRWLELSKRHVMTYRSCWTLEVVHFSQFSPNAN